MKLRVNLRAMLSYSFLAVSMSLLSACGGGGGADTAGKTPVAATSSTGVFEDSVVGGLSYETETLSGTTNSAGEYDYLPGETVTFSIGGIVFGSVEAGPLVTPLSLVAGAIDETDPVVTNIVRLLLTLDVDGDPDNGITISAATALAAEGQTIDFTAADFDAETVALLAAIPGTQVLVEATVAQTHFAETLASQTSWGALAWGTGTWEAAAQ